jgi:hypothetical protein
MVTAFLEGGLLWMFVLYIVALLVVCSCGDRPQAGEADDRPPAAGRIPPPGDLRPAQEAAAAWPVRELRPMRNLRAACTAEYRARFAQVLQQIRIG